MLLALLVAPDVTLTTATTTSTDAAADRVAVNDTNGATYGSTDIDDDGVLAALKVASNEERGVLVGRAAQTHRTR